MLTKKKLQTKGCPFMVYHLLQHTCYDNSVSYITQCTEFVSIFPHNANGWCCQDIDLELVFQVFPRDPRVPTPFWVVDQRVALLRHWFQKHQLRHSTQCLGSILWESSEHSFLGEVSSCVCLFGNVRIPECRLLKGVILINFVRYPVCVDACCMGNLDEVLVWFLLQS